MASVSFVDDLHPLPAIPRLLTHGLGAVLLTLAGVQERELTLLVALPLAFVWIALVTNVYNFMDGIDGLAATQAIVAGAALALAGSIVSNPLIAIGGGLLAAASAGFLVYNLPPARLFMGDVGSTFLGFSFAGLSLLGNIGVGGGRLPVEFGVVILAPFLFDSLVTLARRIARGERWYAAHRSHYYQRLVQRGLSHQQVTSLYAGLAVVAACAGLAGLVVDTPLRQALAVAGVRADAGRGGPGLATRGRRSTSPSNRTRRRPLLPRDIAESPMNTICLLGLGYIGLPTGSMFALAGKDVIGVDPSPRVQAALQVRPGADRRAGARNAGHRRHQVRAPARPDRPEPADAFIIAVPTPLDPATNRADLTLRRAGRARHRPAAAARQPGRPRVDRAARHHARRAGAHPGRIRTGTRS